jgi:lipopolysaccharide/colanic/teichoic acid biosynthesis glycosyltransferase
LYRGYVKRTIDIGLVVLALPIVIPTVLILALLIALDGGTPVFRQKRLGRGGKVFTMMKLRTMQVDAEARLREHLSRNDKAHAEWAAFQKLENDPRVTRIGQFLRRSSLDELPQLWNVLIGDMSLVGPRPMLPEQRHLYPGEAYYTMRPGVTGLWQVSDRNTSTFARRADFDAVYERSLSFATDIRVLAATFSVVLRCTGK